MQGVRFVKNPAITHGTVDLPGDGVHTQCGRMMWLTTTIGVITKTGNRVEGEVDCMACIAAEAST